MSFFPDYLYDALTIKVTSSDIRHAHGIVRLQLAAAVDQGMVIERWKGAMMQ